MGFPKLLYFLLLALSVSIPLQAKQKDEELMDPWMLYVHTSPIADLLKRPNFGAQGVWHRYVFAFKASWFKDASQVFDYGLDSGDSYGNLSANGFEIGPQFGYLLDLTSWIYLIPRLGVYRSIVHYSGGHSACKNGQTGDCAFAPSVDGWALDVMGMLHIPVIGGFHVEAGAGIGTQLHFAKEADAGGLKLLVELNAGYAF